MLKLHAKQWPSYQHNTITRNRFLFDMKNVIYPRIYTYNPYNIHATCLYFGLVIFANIGPFRTDIWDFFLSKRYKFFQSRKTMENSSVWSRPFGLELNIYWVLNQKADIVETNYPSFFLMEWSSFMGFTITDASVTALSLLQAFRPSLVQIVKLFKWNDCISSWLSFSKTASSWLLF